MRLLCSWYLGKSDLFTVYLKDCSEEVYQQRSVSRFSTTEILKELPSEHPYIYQLNSTNSWHFILLSLYIYSHSSIFLKKYLSKLQAWGHLNSKHVSVHIINGTLIFYTLWNVYSVSFLNCINLCNTNFYHPTPLPKFRQPLFLVFQP